jgi:hypothetical protein
MFSTRYGSANLIILGNLQVRVGFRDGVSLFSDIHTATSIRRKKSWMCRTSRPYYIITTVNQKWMNSARSKVKRKEFKGESKWRGKSTSLVPGERNEQPNRHNGDEQANGLGTKRTRSSRRKEEGRVWQIKVTIVSSSRKKNDKKDLILIVSKTRIMNRSKTLS